MDAAVAARRGETAAHAALKRAALIWAQAHGYRACAAEVSLPRCRYRADAAAYRPANGALGVTAIFECKQARSDLRRDNCRTDATRERLRSVQRRRETLERCLRIHHPTLRSGDSLFPEFDAADFSALQHTSYARVLRELTALQNSLGHGAKFECLVRYGCANVFYLVVPVSLFVAAEVPVGWGALVQNGGALELLRKPVWHEIPEESCLRLLERIAAAGTRQFNRHAAISREEIALARAASALA